MGDAPPDYIAMMLQGIIGVEIAFTRVVAKSKLSQNREERDRAGAAQALEQLGHHELSRGLFSR